MPYFGNIQLESTNEHTHKQHTHNYTYTFLDHWDSKSGLADSLPTIEGNGSATPLKRP